MKVTLTNSTDEPIFFKFQNEPDLHINPHSKITVDLDEGVEIEKDANGATTFVNTKRSVVG